MNQRRRFGAAECRVAAVDDILEIGRRDLARRNVQRQDLVGEVGEAQILPRLPVLSSGDLLGDVETAIVSEALEDDFFERKLYIATGRLAHAKMLGD